MFGRIKNGESGEIFRNNNFQSFTQALLVLFRSSTGIYVLIAVLYIGYLRLIISFYKKIFYYVGESWQNIMLDCLQHEQSSDGTECEDPQDNECGSDTAYAYFISFYVLCSFLVSTTIHVFLIRNITYYM